MGYGDVLMTMGEARVVHEATGMTVALPRKHYPELWSIVPYIRADGEVQLKEAFPCAYGVEGGRIKYRRYQPIPADLSVEPVRNGSYAFIEPHAKVRNKEWPIANYQRVVDATRDRIEWVQCDYGKPLLAGVTSIKTPSFLDGCAVLAGARLGVFAEGGLHHAAAALGVRSVVIFGGFVPPWATGYGMHVNIYRGPPCGSKQDCAHCASIMRDIEPWEIIDAVDSLWRE